MTSHEIVECRQFLEYMDDMLDHELEAQVVEMLQAHLKDCPDCMQLYLYQQELIQTIRIQLQSSETPAGLRVRIAESLRQENHLL